MMNLPETRHVSRLLFREWFPQIVYNQHQTAPFPARIFIPPYAEPLNPNIPAAVMEGINLIGAAMRERFARENKPGAISLYSFDAWWNGGLRSAPAFHNMHGILTETARLRLRDAARIQDRPSCPSASPTAMPAREPTMFYPRPWLGGHWGAARRRGVHADRGFRDPRSGRHPARALSLEGVAAGPRGQIEAGGRGKPYAYVVPPSSGTLSSAVEMVRRLQMAGIRSAARRRSSRPAGRPTRRGRSSCWPRNRSADTLWT